MKLLSQRDKQWANVKIGRSNLTVGNYGCVITDLSMLSDWYSRYRGSGEFKTPETLARKLEFTHNGLLYWGSIEKVLGFKFDWRSYIYDEKRISDALGGKNTSCLIRIYGGAKTHWLIGIKKAGNYYWVADPFPLPSGQRKFINKNIITGSATFKIK